MSSGLENLQTAAHYVNNLLLSRGLLRNGVAIEFAHPSKGEGGKEATMAKIINLIHDMVLRRDRETETTTSLSKALSTIRTTAAFQAQSIARLETKSSDLERQLSLSGAQERAAKASLKISENRNRALREDISRLKATAGQIRAQCANDIRKRDTEIARLKKHLDGRRGKEASAQVGRTVITPGMSKPKLWSVRDHGVSDLESPLYSLKEETTEFLTQLTQNLSDENDALIGLVQSALSTLKELQGLQTPPQNEREEDYGDANVHTDMPPSYKTLTSDMDEVLEHLRSLLTNPSFVPLEEVHVREEEIMRLRQGFERMESKWREAIAMIGSWRKRMIETGDTINLDDLRKGLNLDSDNFVPSSTGPRPSTSSSAFDDSILLSHGADQDESKVEQAFAAESVSPLKKESTNRFPAPSILQATSGNACLSPSPRKEAYQDQARTIETFIDAISEDDDITLGADIANTDGPSPRKKRKSEVFEMSRTHNYANQEQDNESAMTVQEKLRKAEEDAAEALQEQHTIDAKQKSRVKRTAIPRQIKSTRRSTLSPEELDGLMGIS